MRAIAAAVLFAILGVPDVVAKDDKAPVPRERPMTQEEVVQWLLEDDKRAMSDETRREWEEFERDPETYMDEMYRRHFDDLRRQQQPRRLMEAAEGTREADI
jgi:predicted phage gp36 major capsid-like protein